MRHIWGHCFRRTTLWLLVCVAFLAGVGLARTGGVPGWPWCLLCLVGLLLGLRQRNALTVVLVIAVGLSFGWQRGSVFMGKLRAYDAFYGHKITVSVQASEDAVYGKKSQLTFIATNIRSSEGQKLAGKLQVSGFGLNAVFQGDTVQVTGKLYPGFGAYQGEMSFAQLQIIAHQPSLVAEVRCKFAAGTQSALPEPLASFSMGLLIGQRATLPANVKQD